MVTKDNLEIGGYYSAGGEAIYKLVDIGVDWVCVIHYSTVHYVADAEFFKLEEFMSDFTKEVDDWNDYIFNEELTYSDWQTLINKERT